jgi:hypothetical protein
LSFIFQNLNDDFVRLLLLIQCQLIFPSLKSAASAHLTYLAIRLLQIYESLVLFGFVRLMILVESKSLKQEYEQVNEPDKCDLEV